MKFSRAFLPVIGALSALIAPIQARSRASQAIRQLTPIDNAVIHTPFHQIEHTSHFDLTFELHRDGKRIKLELEPNLDILADDANVRYMDNDGNWKDEPFERSDHKVFRGRALVGSGQGRWTPTGWARVNIRKDGPEPLFEGVFSVDENKHHVELHSTYSAKQRAIDADVEDRAYDYMLVYRDTDMIRGHVELKRSVDDSTGCQAEKLDYNAELTSSLFPAGIDMPDGQWGFSPLNSMFGMSKRNDVGGVSGSSGGVNLKSTIGDTSGCPKTKKVALIGVATDCQMTNVFKSNSTPKDAAKEWVINLVNTASSLYEDSFNVSIGLRNLTISDASCPTTANDATPWNMGCDSGNITWRLNEFSKWRSDHEDNNAYWTLMTGCPTGQEVGVSWMSRLCTSDLSSSGGSSVTGANVVVGNSGSTWQIFAHETGHTFGAVHDCDTQTCQEDLNESSQCCPLSSSTCDADAKYIMNPYADDKMTKFSQCTIGNICAAIGRNSVKSSCLSDNKGVVTISGSQCGNGIVESGEDCDCGGESGCGDNSCCDAKTCKFKDNAVCDDSNDNCCSKCQFASANTVCRASTSECDKEEKCDGKSSSCPADAYEKDGSSCGDGLKCASGQCTSRNRQCRSVMGTLLNSNDTWACDNTNQPSCTLVCGAPRSFTQYAYGTCIEMNQNYLDGTPCESGGTCSSGQCKGSSAAGWIRDHKNLVIGICVGVGSLILLAIFFCLINRCRMAKANSRLAKRPPPGAPPMGRYAGPPPPRGPPPPPQGQWYGYSNYGYQNVPPPGPPGPPPRYA